jgi:hypothetical protein
LKFGEILTTQIGAHDAVSSANELQLGQCQVLPDDLRAKAVDVQHDGQGSRTQDLAVDQNLAGGLHFDTSSLFEMSAESEIQTHSMCIVTTIEQRFWQLGSLDKMLPLLSKSSQVRSNNQLSCHLEPQRLI